MLSGPRFLRAASALLFACNLAGCNLDNPGDAPPRATLYFPNGLALSPHADDAQARYLYVVNSDFDLRYNAGTVQAYSLDAIDKKLAACKTKGAGCTIAPGDVLVDEVAIAPFSTGLATSPSGDRLLITTRTSDNLPYVHADPTADGDDVLRCDGGGARCGLEAESGPDRYQDSASLAWPDSPVSVTSGRLSDWIDDPDFAPDGDADEYAMTAHRSGQMSLFIEHDGELTLTDVQDRIAVGATDLAYDDQSGFLYATEYLATQPRALARFGITIPSIDGALDPLGAYVYDAGGVVLQPVDIFRDTRGITFMPPLPGQGAMLATPNALIAAQNPSSLVLADVTHADDGERGSNFPRIARVKGMTELGFGASRVVSAVVDGVPIAIVASFDARELALIDLRTMLTRSVIPNLSGPFAVALDPVRQRVYCTDFRSSVIRILDIAPALDPDNADPVEVVATLGSPRVLQELR